MKKIFYLLVSSILLSACGQQFTINGKIDPSLECNNQIVTLIVEDGDSTASFTTQVSNNAFSLSHKVIEPSVAYLKIENLGTYALCSEPGTAQFTITANADTTSRVKAIISCVGTPNNTLLDAFNQAESFTYKNIAQAKTEEETNELEAAYIEMAYNFVNQNINTIAGNYVFSNTYYYMNLDQVGEILGKLDEKSLAFGRIPRIKSGYEAMIKTAEGQQFTDFILSTPEGEELALSSLIGKTDYLLIDFWASWCGPCRRAMPALKELYSKYSDNFEILGVSLDNDRDAWLNAIANLGLTWKHVSDLQGWKCTAGQIYGVSAIPSTILINKDGIIVGRNLSEKEIATYLAQ